MSDTSSDETLSASKGMPPEQLADARRWVEIRKETGRELERIRRQKLRQRDGYRAIQLLCGHADYMAAPRAPRRTSGLIEQQRWFLKAAGRE